MNVEQRDATQKTLLFYAVAGDVPIEISETLDCLIQKQDSFGTTSLMFAAKFGRVSWVQYLVEDECGFKDLQGRTALMYAIGSLNQIETEYIRFSDPEIELKLKIIDFLFDYEWHILDNTGQTCLDYLKLTKIDRAFIEYITDRFVKHCTAYGTPKGVLVEDQVLKMRLDDEHRGQNVRVKSIYEEVVRLNEEIMRWKQVTQNLQKELGQNQNKEQIEQIQNENEELKKIIQQQTISNNTQKVEAKKLEQLVSQLKRQVDEAQAHAAMNFQDQINALKLENIKLLEQNSKGELHKPVEQKMNKNDTQKNEVQNIYEKTQKMLQPERTQEKSQPQQFEKQPVYGKPISKAESRSEITKVEAIKPEPIQIKQAEKSQEEEPQEEQMSAAQRKRLEMQKRIKEKLVAME
ncbi:Ankyrin_repeat-containing protein [Hexamita inflata]|uniref:Ankyrin repeat-containing protein n=1 Tax=Hexamita inflata TaxID=28002 RepID=A0AA86NM49_9EUKA|nr:Ankyrin repeat-containing protein [Hexamita inflata]